MSFEKVENPEIKDIIEHCIRPRKEDRWDPYLESVFALNNCVKQARCCDGHGT